jgi:hypothetical protein
LSILFNRLSSRSLSPKQRDLSCSGRMQVVAHSFLSLESTKRGFVVQEGWRLRQLHSIPRLGLVSLLKWRFEIVRSPIC